MPGRTRIEVAVALPDMTRIRDDSGCSEVVSQTPRLLPFYSPFESVRSWPLEAISFYSRTTFNATARSRCFPGSSSKGVLKIQGEDGGAQWYCKEGQGLVSGERRYHCPTQCNMICHRLHILIVIHILFHLRLNIREQFRFM